MKIRRSKRLEPLAFFEGTWRGVAKLGAAAEGEEAHVTLMPDLGGDFLTGTFVVGAAGVETDEDDGDAKDVELEGRHVWGYDPLKREFFRTFFDSTGLFGTVRSKGWDGDTWIWEGEATTSEQVLAIRQTVKRTGPDAWEATWEAKFEGDVWTVTSVESFERDRDAPGKYVM